MKMSPEERRAKKAASDRKYADKNRERIRQKKKDWAIRNAERLKANRAAHYAANREAILAQQHEYYLKNPERIRAKTAKWVEENPERKKATDKAHREKNKERVQEQQAQWRAENPDKIREYRHAHPEKYRANAKRHRALTRGATISDFTHAQWVTLQEAFDHRCAYCGKRAKGHLTQDHIIPVTKGGNHTLSNIVPACRSCNSKKGAGEPLCPVQPLLL